MGLPSSQPLVFQSDAPTTRNTRCPFQASGMRIVRAYQATSASSETPDSFAPQGNGTLMRSGNAVFDSNQRSRSPASCLSKRNDQIGRASCRERAELTWVEGD